MLIPTKRAFGTAVDAEDGKLGTLCDLVFDDQTWNVTSLVLDAGTWLHSYRLTIPPSLIHRRQWSDHRLLISGLTREKVMEQPGTQKHDPAVETGALGDMGVVAWDFFWIDVAPHPWEAPADPHLHGVREVTGYHLDATDGPLGHVADFVLDDEQWRMAFLVVDTRNWWPGKHVVISPVRVAGLDRHQRILHLNLSRSEIEHSRPWDGTAPLSETGEASTAAAGSSAVGPRSWFPRWRHHV